MAPWSSVEEEARVFTREAEFERGLQAVRRALALALTPPDPVETPVPDPAAALTRVDQWKTLRRSVSSEYNVCWIVSRTRSVRLNTSIESSAAPDW